MSEQNNSTGGQQGGQKPTLSWSQPAAAKPATAPNANTGVTNTTPKPAAPATPVKSANVSASADSSNMGTYIGIFVAGLIIGALVGWGITSGKSGSTATVATSTSMATSSGNSAAAANSGSGTIDLSGATAGPNSVTLAAQQQAGFAVAVSKVIVTQPTWLVVYEDHNGVPGNAIGAGLFFSASIGGNTSGTIQLLRATLPGQSYFVGQSLDDGDKIFSLQNDKPVRDAQGNPLLTQFTTN